MSTRLIGLLISILGLIVSLNGCGYQSHMMNFKEDNAVGAAANATESMAIGVRGLQVTGAGIAIILFGYVVMAFPGRFKRSTADLPFSQTVLPPAPPSEPTMPVAKATTPRSSPDLTPDQRAILLEEEARSADFRRRG